MKSDRIGIFRKVWCRAFQGAFRLALPVLPYRNPVVFGSVDALPDILREKGKRSVLVVTDPGVLKHKLADMLLERLDGASVKYGIFSDIRPNPTVENIENARKAYISQNADAIIAIGGGSAIDAAKALGARIAHPRKSLARMGGILRVFRPLPMFVAIPTTAGTGSETTLAAIVTDPERQRKYALMSFPLIPHYAVLDPRMTLTLPPHLTATTGMDALTHAIEAFIGRSTTRETRTLAIDAVRLIFANIEKAFEDGTDLGARSNMLLASHKAGLAFSKSYVGYVHAIAHSLGGRYDTPHGLANAVILPEMLAEYGECIHGKLSVLAKAAGICGAGDAPAVAAAKFVGAIRKLNVKMGIPAKIDAISESDIPQLAARAEKEANPLYPVPRLMTAGQLEKIYRIISK